MLFFKMYNAWKTKGTIDLIQKQNQKMSIEKSRTYVN